VRIDRSRGKLRDAEKAFKRWKTATVVLAPKVRLVQMRLPRAARGLHRLTAGPDIEHGHFDTTSRAIRNGNARLTTTIRALPRLGREFSPAWTRFQSAARYVLPMAPPFSREPAGTRPAATPFHKKVANYSAKIDQ
jgi:hypothetical protein